MVKHGLTTLNMYVNRPINAHRGSFRVRLVECGSVCGLGSFVSGALANSHRTLFRSGCWVLSGCALSGVLSFGLFAGCSGVLGSGSLGV